MTRDIYSQMGKDWDKHSRRLMMAATFISLIPLLGCLFLFGVLWIGEVFTPEDLPKLALFLLAMLAFSFLILLPARIHRRRTRRQMWQRFLALPELEQNQFRREAAAFARSRGLYPGELGLWLGVKLSLRLLPYEDIAWVYCENGFTQTPIRSGGSLTTEQPILMRQVNLVVVTRDKKKYRAALLRGDNPRPRIGQIGEKGPHIACGYTRARKKLARRDWAAFQRQEQGWPENNQ